MGDTELKALIVDLLAYSKGTRLWTRDVIGSGPRAVGGVLEQRGVEVDLITGDYFLDNRRLLESYDVLLLSGMVTDFPMARSIIRAWRKIKKKRPIIAGGPFSGYGERILDDDVDIVVVGEAEATLWELAQTGVFKDGEMVGEEISKIRGIMFRVGRTKIFTGPRPPLTTEELKKYKPSCRLATHYENFWAYRFYVETVRGCSNFSLSPIASELRLYYPGCAYCSVPSYWGPARSLPLERIIDEVRCLLDQGVTRVVLSAPDVLDYGRDWASKSGKFATSPYEPPPNVRALENLFKGVFERTGFSGDKNSIIVENVKPTTVNEETASLLGEYFKGTPVNIGVESGDEALLRRVGRPGTLARALEAVELLAKSGLYPQVYLIYGLPGQGSNSLLATFNILSEVIRRGADRIILYRFMPLPKTPLEGFKRREQISDYEEKLEEEIRRINREMKKRMIGRKLLGIVVSRKGDDYIAYPLRHGPVIYIEGSANDRENLIGRVVKVLITGVYSDRALIGKVLSVGKMLKRKSYWAKDRRPKK